MQMSNKSWQTMLEDMQSSEGGGKFFFVQKGRTRVRLIPEKGTETNEFPSFFIETQGFWQNKPKKRFVVRGLVVEADGRELSEEDQHTVRPLLVAPQVVKKILALLSGGWDLLGTDTGHGITILRSGTGINTEYDVVVSPTAKPIAEFGSIIDMPESLAQLDKEYRVQAAGQSGGDKAPAASPAPAEEDNTGAGW